MAQLREVPVDIATTPRSGASANAGSAAIPAKLPIATQTKVSQTGRFTTGPPKAEAERVAREGTEEGATTAFFREETTARLPLRY
jgi:hypothetical protein